MKKHIHTVYKKRGLWFVAMAGILAIWLAIFLLSFPDGKLRLVFCNVGQGDGIYIDLPDGSDVLIDGGPNQKILECLGENMPFWDRELEMVVLTHPQADHLSGLIDVLQRYKVDRFVTSPVGNETNGYKKLVGLIKENDVQVQNVYTGDKIKFKVQPRTRDSVSVRGIGSTLKVNPKLLIANYQLPSETEFRVLWPSREFVASNIDKGSSDPLFLKEALRNVLGATTEHSDLNDFSVVLELKFGAFEALMGGDADEEIQDDILAAAAVRPVEVFKVPHHGSKRGILEEYLDKAAPKFAVISVGKNRWGHPSDLIIKRLKAVGAKVYRTDKNGKIKFTTDGKQIWIKSDRK